MCARVVPRVIPKMAPRACGSQSGAPKPVSAGTNTTPPLSGTLNANSSDSEAMSMMPSPSRSHCTAEPVTNTAPSNANSREPSGCCQATVVSRPDCERTNLSPVFTNTNDPVP